MQEFKIFTESPADVKFIKDYIIEHFKTELTDAHFDTLGGWGGYKKEGIIKASVRLAKDENRQIIVILDADNDFIKRYSEVTKDFENSSIQAHLFLFPNHNSNGNLEDLLTAIAADRKLINCFLGYEECVKEYNLPLEKSRIYSYLDSILSPECKTRNNDMRIEANRDYRNPAHWNLHHEYLNPLQTFLTPFFQ